MGLQKHMVRGVAWTAAARWVHRLSALVVFTILARLLEPEDFGLVAFASVLTNLMKVFVEAGMGEALVQRKRLTSAHRDTAFWTLAGMGVLMMGLTIAVAPLFAMIIEDRAIIPLIYVMSLSLPIAGLGGVHQAILQRRMRFKRLGRCVMISSLTGGATGVVMAFAGAGAWALVGQLLAATTAMAAGVSLASGWRPRWRFSGQAFKELIDFGSKVIGIRLLNFVNRQADALLIGAFLGKEMLGYYTVAYKVLIILNELLINTLNTVALPVFSKLQVDRERLTQAFLRAISLIALVVFPVYLSLSATASDFVHVVFGSKWALSGDVMRVLALVGIIHGAFSINQSSVKAVGRPGVVLGLLAMNATVNLIVFISVVQFGIFWVAVGYVSRAYILAPVVIYVTARVIGLDLKAYFRTLATPLIAGLGMVAAILAASWLASSLEPWARLTIAVLVGLATYPGAVLLIDRQRLVDILSVARHVRPQRSPAGAAEAEA